MSGCFLPRARLWTREPVPGISANTAGLEAEADAF